MRGSPGLGSGGGRHGPLYAAFGVLVGSRVGSVRMGTGDPGRDFSQRAILFPDPLSTVGEFFGDAASGVFLWLDVDRILGSLRSVFPNEVDQVLTRMDELASTVVEALVELCGPLVSNHPTVDRQLAPAWTGDGPIEPVFNFGGAGFENGPVPVVLTFGLDPVPGVDEKVGGTLGDDGRPCGTGEAADPSQSFV